MTTSPQVMDQYGQVDVESNRYLWALRRAWAPLLAAAVLGGLLLAALVGESVTTTTTRMLVDDGSSALASTRLEPEAFEDIPTRTGVTEHLNGGIATDVESSALEDVTNEQTIILTVTGGSESVTIAGTEQLVQGADAWVGERRADVAEPVIAVLEQEIATIEERLAELDREIGALEGSDALRDAYLAERSDLTEARLEAESGLEALTRYGQVPGNVLVVGTSTTSTNSRVMWFIVGAVLGVLIAAAVVVVRAHTDRRVRSVSEVGIAAGAEPLPLLPRSGTEREAAVAALVAAVARQAGESEVLLVPSDDGEARTHAEALAADAPMFRVYSPRTSGDSIPAGTLAVILAVSGRTHSDDVARTRAYLRALGCDVVGAVLDGVRPRDMRPAMA